jgi:hypothetical protein
MATTASGVVTKALQKILVAAAEQGITSSEMQIGISEMNDMMFEFDATGISLGYTEVLTPTDLITVPVGAIGGVVAQLAVRLSPYFNMPVSPGLSMAAQNGLKALYKLGLTIRPSSRPCTLPVGSGNETSGTYNNDRFYPCPEPSILTEDNGHILLENNTNGE